MATNDRQRDETFLGNFKRFFVRGLAALLPTLLTIAILVWAYNLIEHYIGQYITRGFIAALSVTAGAPSTDFVDPTADALKYGERITEWDETTGRWLTKEYKVLQYKARKGLYDRERTQVLWRLAFAKYRFHLVGFLVAIILVYFVGFFLASFFGRTTLHVLERLWARIPLVKAVYPYVKQVTDFVFRERQLEFASVVAVQYPRKGLWSVGLVTGPPLRAIQASASSEMVTLFVPSSPTPFTGYVITAPRADVVELPLSIDEALRFTVSGGVIRPGHEAISAEAAGAIARQRAEALESSQAEVPGRPGGPSGGS